MYREEKNTKSSEYDFLIELFGNFKFFGFLELH